MKLTIACFLLLLVLPGLLMVVGVSIVEPVDEHRELASLPSLDPRDWIGEGSEFAGAFTAWFDDHYGVRDLLIRLENQIDYSLFRTADNVYVGEEGWLYYESVLSNQVWIERHPDELLPEVFDEYDELYRSLQERGVQLVVLTVPLKPTIYPEYLPARAPGYSGESPFQKLRHFLNEHGGIIHIDTQPLLLALKKRIRVFYKTDFHWTSPAAFEVSRELVNRLALHEGLPADLWREELVIREKTFSGGQARFMPMLSSLDEWAPFVEGGRPVPRDPVREGIWHNVRRYQEGDGPKLPSTVVRINSFWHGMTISGVEYYFEEFRSVGSHTSVSEVLDNLPLTCRYLILQFLEGEPAEQLVLGLVPPPGARPPPR